MTAGARGDVSLPERAILLDFWLAWGRRDQPQRGPRLPRPSVIYWSVDRSCYADIMPIQIECPSGLAGKVRGLKGRDGRYLTDRSLQRKGTLINHILTNCWLETTDAGIYTLTAGGVPNWDQVLQGDRTYALLQIRTAGSESSTFEFSVQCKDRDCREKFPWEIDLDELPVKLLAPEVREQLAKGENRFEIRMPGTEELKQLEAGDANGAGIVLDKPRQEIVPNTGTKIWFSLPIGADEAKMAKLSRQKSELTENQMVASIAMRIRQIEGVTFRRGKRIEDALAYLEDFDLQKLAVLLDRFDALDCGVDTVIEVQCPHCQSIMDIELPFDENFFFKRERRIVR